MDPASLNTSTEAVALVDAAASASSALQFGEDAHAETMIASSTDAKRGLDTFSLAEKVSNIPATQRGSTLDALNSHLTPLQQGQIYHSLAQIDQSRAQGLPQGRSQAPLPPRLPCSKEVKILEKVGNDFKNYGAVGLVLSGGATLLAPESGAELGIEPSLAAIAVGNALTSSTSLTRAVLNGANGSGATLSYINDQVLSAVHVPEKAVPLIEPLLDKAEESAALTEGDAGACHE